MAHTKKIRVSLKNIILLSNKLENSVATTKYISGDIRDRLHNLYFYIDICTHLKNDTIFLSFIVIATSKKYGFCYSVTKLNIIHVAECETKIKYHDTFQSFAIYCSKGTQCSDTIV